MSRLNRFVTNHSLWLVLGTLTLFLKQRLDFTITINEGVVNPDSAVVFTNQVTVMDPLLWVIYTLFGALFVTRQMSDQFILYPFVAGRVTTRKHLVIQETIEIFVWTAIYVVIGFLATCWKGSLSLGTIYCYGYSWLGLSGLIVLLMLLEKGVHRIDNAIAVWLIFLFLSTPNGLAYWFPWMYGQSYSSWLGVTPIVPIGLLLVFTLLITSFYIDQRQKADWH